MTASDLIYALSELTLNNEDDVFVCGRHVYVDVRAGGPGMGGTADAPTVKATARDAETNETLGVFEITVSRKS